MPGALLPPLRGGVQPNTPNKADTLARNQPYSRVTRPVGLLPLDLHAGEIDFDAGLLAVVIQVAKHRDADGKCSNHH